MTIDLLTMALPIADIAIGDRIGFFNAVHASRIGSSMEAEGQRHPIQVKRNGNAAAKPWTLVAGLHRLRGASGRGWVSINAIQVAEASATAAELRRLELAENIDHRHRRPIERAIMMNAHSRLEEAADYPDTVGEPAKVRAGRVRQSAAVTVTAAENWLDRTAKAFDISLSSLERHRRLHRAIVEAMPDLAQRINDHPLGESFAAMRDLASLKLDSLHDQRRKAAEKLLERDDWLNMSAVLEAAGIKESNGNRTAPNARLYDSWSRASLQERKAHIEWLADQVTPSMAIDMVARFKERGVLP